MEIDNTTTGHVPLPNFRELGKVCGFTDLANAYEQACKQRDAMLALIKVAIERPVGHDLAWHKAAHLAIAKAEGRAE